MGVATRVLLVNANRARELLPPPPVGLAYVASAAAGAGHHVSFVDLLTASDPRRALVRALGRDAPTVVGVSVRNLDNAIRQDPRSQVSWAREVVALIRERSDATIVLGGPAVSLLGAGSLTSIGGDAAVVGDGEVVFPRLLDTLGGGGDPAAVPGVITVKDATGESAPIAAPETFGPSGMERWVRWAPYERRGATWSIQTKRGCPLHCSYCAYAAIEGRRIRLRDPEDVAEEMARVAAAVGPRTFEFVDSTFNLPTDHAAAVCEAVVARRPGAAITAEGINVGTLTPELLGLMRAAGFNSIMLSPESADDDVLAGLRKGFSTAEVTRAAEMVRKSGITSLWFFLLGAPGETRASVDRTLRFIERELAWSGCLVVVTTGVRVLPNTEVERRAQEEGLLRPGYDRSEPTFYLAPGVGERWLLSRVADTIDRAPNVVHAAEQDPPVLQRAGERVLHLLGVAPPYWRLTPRILAWPPVHRYRTRHPVAPRQGGGETG